MTTDRPGHTPEPHSDPHADPRFDAAWRAASREVPPAALDAAILAAARRAVGAGPQPVVVLEATRPERWWWPLAAAASIGAVAIGILQLVALDRAGTPDEARVIVSDMPAPSSALPSAPASALPSTPSSALPSAPASAPAAAPSSVPLPESTAVTASGSSGDGAARDGSAPVRKERNGLPPGDRSAQPFPAGAAPTPARERDSAPPAGLGKVVTAPAAAARANVQTGERGPRPVAEWIALIRKLRAEGRTEELAREIAAFRAAYPDQQQRLDDDLAAAHPQAPPPAR
jgi:hypothetical protein